MNSPNSVQINGFIVVRLPPMNKDLEGRGAYPAIAPCMGNLYYGGVDRMPWFEIDELFYKGILPDNINQARKIIHGMNRDLSGIDLCGDFELAVRLLHYSNSVYNYNELIAIRSEKLADFKSTVTLDASLVKWLGYDIVVIGEQSLLCDGLFTAPLAFQGWEKELNEYGLFRSSDVNESYVEAYNNAVKQEDVEPLGDEYEVATIEIGSIIVPV